MPSPGWNVTSALVSSRSAVLPPLASALENADREAGRVCGGNESSGRVGAPGYCPAGIAEVTS